MIELQLPFPPSANRLWTRTKRGMRRTDGYRKWLRQAHLEAALRGDHREVPIGKYKLTLHAKRPDERRRDLDNLLKSVGDFLQEYGVIKDDSLCQMITARWVTSGEPGVYVRVEPAGTE